MTGVRCYTGITSYFQGKRTHHAIRVAWQPALPSSRLHPVLEYQVLLDGTPMTGPADLLSSFENQQVRAWKQAQRGAFLVVLIRPLCW